MELGRVAHNRRIDRIESPLETHVSGQRRCEQLERLFDDCLHVQRLALGHPAAAKHEDAIDEFFRAHARLHHLIDVATYNAAFAQVILRELAVPQDRAQDVVEVVRDAPREAADCFHLLGLAQSLSKPRTLGFRGLALGQVEDECHPLFAGAFESCAGKENRDTLAVLADVFLLVGLASSELPYLFDCVGVRGAIFRCRYAGPCDTAGQKILSRVAHASQKCVIRLGDAAVKVPEEHSDDIGLDEPPDACFALAKRLLCLLAVAILLPQIGIKPRVLQRNRRLGSQHLQDCYPARTERIRCQVVLQVQQADQCGLPHDRQAQHRLGLPAGKVVVRRKGVRLRRIDEQHPLLAAPDVIDDGCGQRGLGRGLVRMQPHLNRLLLDACLGREYQAPIVGEQQMPGLCTGIFEHNAHQRVDQFFQDDLARYRLRTFDNSREIQVFHRRPDRVRWPGRWLCLPDVRI